MYKKIIKTHDTLNQVLPAVKEIAGIVKTTLGPGGRPILIQRVGQALNGEPLGPKITKDGVSVANECASKDPEKDIIIQAVKHICKRTNTTAGDGTTTAIVLGEALITEMLSYMQNNPDTNVQLLKVSLQTAVDRAIEHLKDISVEADNYDLIQQVATLSANGDETVGKIIRDAFEAVGAKGVVTIDEGTTTDITLDVVGGFQFNRGAEGREMFFNSSDGTKFESDNCGVIVFDGKLNDFTKLAAALMNIAEKDANGNAKSVPPVLVLANDFSNEVLTWINIQKTQAGLNICPVRGPNQTTVRTAYYNDIAFITGGQRLGNGNPALETLSAESVGFAEKVVVTKYATTIYAKPQEETLLGYVDKLEIQKSKAESPYDAQIISDRIASLTNGVAKVGIGGATDFEVKERYDRVEDALNAARAAIEEGVVPGGGIALRKYADFLESKETLTEGEMVLANALKYPFEQILTNVGLEDKATCLFEALKDEDKLTYNARSKKVVNFLEAGIVDPVKVTRLALQNATSIAALLSTTGGSIIYVKD
jgi:chaperonin GroEL